MMHPVRALLASAISLSLLVGVSAQPAGVAAKEPDPPATLPPGSVVYHTLTGREAQVVFTSEAPVENIVGKSNAVVGYAVPGPKEQPAALVSAAWVLPVRSLATGIPLRDQHLAGKEWLDAETHPEIRFTLTRVDDIKEVKRGEGYTTWSAALVGQMTIHGVSRELRVADARLSFFEASPKTAAIAPGNLVFLKCEYSVTLSEFGIRHADVPDKVADNVRIAQTLRLSSASPEAIEQARTQAASEQQR